MLSSYLEAILNLIFGGLKDVLSHIFFLPQHTVAISELTNGSLFDKGFFPGGIIFKEYIQK